MNFKLWLLSEEIFPNKTATVYHRTKSIKDVSGILTSDYKVGKGCYYGCGLYTTFAIESQFTDYMKTYGKAVVKFKVTDLDKYLIFQLSVAKQIHGKDYKISSQLKKLGVSNKVTISVFDDEFDDDDDDNLKYYDERQEKENYSSDLAKEFYEQNKWIENSVKGIIYYGKSDGYCLLKYPTVQDGTITMLGYADSESDDMKKMEELKSNIGWIKSVGVLGTSIKNVYKNPSKMKEKFAFGDYSHIVDQLLNSKNLEKTAQKFGSYINEFTDENVKHFLKNSTDKDKIAELIIKYKKEFSISNVSTLLVFATKIDKIAELIIKKQPELTVSDVSTLLYHSIKKDEIAALIIEKKPELTDWDIYNLLDYAINIEGIAGLIGTDKINNLYVDFVYDLLHYAGDEDKDKMAKALGLYNIKKIDDDVNSLLDILNDKEKMIKMLEKYQAKKKKSQM